MTVITVDTETCPVEKAKKVNPHNMLVYDIGWIVTNSDGTRVLAERSFLVEEVFCGESEKMKSTYYKNKIPVYWELVENGEIEILPLAAIREIFNKDVENFKVKAVCAYNAYFDYTALNNTVKYFYGKGVYFTVKKIEWWDFLKMVNDTIYRMKSYKAFCQKNSYLTKKGNIKRTAEVVYRFLTRDTSFIESHTALADAKIETAIFTSCVKKHKKMRRKLFNN